MAQRGAGWGNRERADGTKTGRNRFLTVLGRRARPRPLKIHREGCFPRENGRGRRLEAVFRPKMGLRGSGRASNTDFEPQMDANGREWGAGTTRGPKSEVGGPKTGKIIAFILFSCCFLFSCLAAGFAGRRSEKSYLREFAFICGRGRPENEDFQQENRKISRKQEGKGAAACFSGVEGRRGEREISIINVQ